MIQDMEEAVRKSSCFVVSLEGLVMFGFDFF